jgi:hypothetical protein
MRLSSGRSTVPGFKTIVLRVAGSVGVMTFGLYGKAGIDGFRLAVNSPLFTPLFGMQTHRTPFWVSRHRAAILVGEECGGQYGPA